MPWRVDKFHKPESIHGAYASPRDECVSNETAVAYSFVGGNEDTSQQVNFWYDATGGEPRILTVYVGVAGSQEGGHLQ